MEVERKNRVCVCVFFSSFWLRREKKWKGAIREFEGGSQRGMERTRQTATRKNAELLHACVCVFDTVNERGSNQEQKKNTCNKCSENALMPNNGRLYGYDDMTLFASIHCLFCCVSATGSANIPKCDVIIIDSSSSSEKKIQ